MICLVREMKTHGVSVVRLVRREEIAWDGLGRESKIKVEVLSGPPGMKTSEDLPGNEEKNKLRVGFRFRA